LALGALRRAVETRDMTVEPRTGLTILSDVECWGLLWGADVGRLAVAVENHPDIFPVNFVVDRGAVVFRTAEGTKLTAAVLGRAVAFEVDGYDRATGDAWSVVLKGPAREIHQAGELFDALYLPLFPWHAAPKHRFVRVVRGEVTGRRFHVVDRSAWSVPSTGGRQAAPE